MNDPLPMGKVVKKPPHRRARERVNVPNAETREAIEAVQRGEVEPAKDAADLLRKLKS
jgi:hypothetical protein